MINLLSKINIIDNSGAKEGIMIKRLVPKVSSRPQKGFAKVGHIISLSVRKTIPNTISGSASSRNAGPQSGSRVKRKNVYQGIVVRTKKLNNIIQKKEYVRVSSSSRPSDRLDSRSVLSAENMQSSPARPTTSRSPVNDFSLRNHLLISRSEITTLRHGCSQSAETLFKLNHPLHFKNNFSSQKLGGHTVTWQDNAVVLVSRGSPRGGEFQPIGTRIKGPICQSLKLQKGCLKIVSISNIH